MPVIINGSTGISGNDGTASTPTIQGTDSNTGIYFPGNDRIAFAEGGVQVGEFDASGNFLFNSGYGSAARAFGCRAWVNFDGTGTVSIRASGNVSSITDNGVGNYTLNFTVAMPDANYSVTSAGAGVVPITDVASGGAYQGPSPDTFATGSVRIIAATNSSTFQDWPIVCVAIFR